MLDDTAGCGSRGPGCGSLVNRALHVGPGLLGRVFNGVGKPLDGGPPLAAERAFRVDGLPMKPSARQAPSEFLETGFTAIDLMNSLVRGQKLPLFSGGGLPHDRIAVDIACNARRDPAGRRGAADDFAIVFAGIGIPHASAEFFREEMERAGRWRVRCCS
jgi:V/A-type H+-transporting ATPase subunit B